MEASPEFRGGVRDMWERYGLLGSSPSDEAHTDGLKYTQYFFLAGLCVLLYDHGLTFSQEVEVIWKRKKTKLTFIFLLVRYYCVAAMIVVCFAYFSTEMTRERCAKWMLFLPLGVTMPLSLLPSILMSVRVWAMYNANRYILGFLLLYLAAQTAAGLWQYTYPGAKPAPLPLDNYEYHFCIYLPPAKIGHFSIMYVSMEVAFDSVIFLLTASRTVYMHYHRRKERQQHRWSTPMTFRGWTLVESLLRDGALYFAAIFSINLTWVVMILHAPTGLRAIAGQPSACLMTTIICRITMNLRVTAYADPQQDASRLHTSGHGSGQVLSSFRPAIREEQVESFSLGPIKSPNAIAGVNSGFSSRDARLSVGYTKFGKRDSVEDNVSDVDKPFANGNGYGDFAFQHKVFEEGHAI
ncbi:hypothetical protein BDY19DRAFT_997766 [Irpex rosettiformis]|uniref:Uncharacterized protein n=1 Tax=Irpex rosettiformis TaxID=378272 RepID=A0ACB8TR02_9APHY|nr:hypothetical protein BDY19DRAFT_997766 [Irpex rosettiformis]